MTPVKFSVVETRYSHDNSPCGDYRESLNAAINYAIGENSRILRKCGYKFEYITDYFDVNDPLYSMQKIPVVLIQR